ncbi:MAG: ABC transporter ATP-binding protein [Sarcina sp.]
MCLVSLSDVSKVYGKGDNKVVALDNVSVDFEKGEFVAIVGTSGSGKSTLLHMIGGVDKATEGEILIDGTTINKLREKELSVLRRRKLGFVFQFFNLVPVLNVRENIELPVLLDNKKVDEDYIKELISLLKLDGKELSLPGQLSGGQQQRVSIGRALSNKPEIILADEPTGNLDSKTAKDIMELLKFSAKKYNQTLIVITHDLDIAAMADRVITIKDGKIS